MVYGALPKISGPPPLPGTQTQGNGGYWGGTWVADPIYGRKAGGFDSSRYFGTPDEFSKLFWQSQEGMPFAYSRYISQEADPSSHYGGWLSDQYNLMKSGFVDASRTNKDLAWSDYIAGHAQDLATKYTQLPGWQQGKNPGVMSAGRRL